MSARGRMTFRALVERRQSGQESVWGETEPVWATHIAALPCYVWSRQRSEAVNASRTVVIDEIRLLVPNGTDITERDRINGVKDRQGNTYIGDQMDIRGVQPRQTHLELLVLGYSS